MALATCDYVRAAVFQQRHLRLALRSGDARRVACSLALECAFHAERGEVTWPSTRRRIDRAIAMADEVGDPFCVGLARVLAGTAAHLCGRFREAWRDLDRGQDQLRSECPGATFEIATAQFLVLSSLAWLGEVRVLLERQPVYLREATERGDTYGIVVMCIGDANLAWLLLDQPQIARDRAQEAAERSALDGYYVEQAEVFLALGRADLYVGDLGALRQRMDTEWPRLERSRLLRRIELVRVASAHLRARAALAEAESIPANRVQALCEAERIARALRREPSTGALALAPLVMAGAAQVRGDDVSAVEHLRASVEALQRADASLHLAVARRYLGKLVAGDEGAALVAKAEGWLSAEGVRNLPAMSRCIVPGFGRVD
jgi:hypothetical protein